MQRSETTLFGWGLIVFGLLVVLVLLPSVAYIVDTRDQAVVLQFGKPVAQRTSPGLYFKVPFIQEVEKLPSTKQFWGDRPTYALEDLPTRDDKKIEVLPWAIWRINDPKAFVQRLRTISSAEQRVAQFTRGAIRDVITQYDLAELVRSTDRPLLTTAGQVGGDTPSSPEELTEQTTEARRVRMNIKHGRSYILEEIKKQCVASLEASQNGIELIDMGISQIEFVESVRIKTFDRWIAERMAISAKNTNDGQRMKQEIVNRASADVERIVGEGQQKANEIRGNVDAEIIRSYADAMNQVGEFYTFVRTLEAYEKAIGGDTRMILTTDSEFLSLLKKLPRDQVPTVAKASNETVEAVVDAAAETSAIEPN